MNRDLFELVKEAQNQDEEALLQLVVIFKPTIKKFSRQLHYEEAETDLIIAFIEIVRKLNLVKFNDVKIIFSYIYNCLLYKKIDLLKAIRKKK